MKRKTLQAVATPSNGTHTIEMLDDKDMVEFKRVLQALASAQQLQEQAAQAAIGAQHIKAFFFDGVKGKYKLTEKDQIAGSGQILRGV